MLSHQIAFTVSPQHLIGLITALLLFSVTRRVTGLVWAGLLPAPMVLLGPDEILRARDHVGGLGHRDRDGFYPAVRTCETAEPWWRWPLQTDGRDLGCRVGDSPRGLRGSERGVRLFGAFGRAGGALEAWARRALVAQPEDFFKIAWIYLRSYYVPGLLPARISATSTGLDPQLDFTNTNRGEAIVVAAIKQDLETFYDRFTVQPLRSGVRFLHDWQGVIKFGAPALSITTVLTLIGLAIGPRRSRVACCCLASAACHCNSHRAHGTYSGRYTVPMPAR